MDSPGFECHQGQSSPCSSTRPNQLWGPPSLLLNRYRGSFPRIKRLKHEADHSSPTSTEVYNEWSYTSTPNTGMFARSGQGQILYFYHKCIKIALAELCKPKSICCTKQLKISVNGNLLTCLIKGVLTSEQVMHRRMMGRQVNSELGFTYVWKGAARNN
jgi:hypothetical protein